MDANITDFVAGAGNDPLWGDIYDSVSFAATTWRTIDKGLNSLPRAFMPHAENKRTFGRRVEGMTWNNGTKKIAVNWRDDQLAMEPESEEYVSDDAKAQSHHSLFSEV